MTEVTSRVAAIDIGSGMTKAQIADLSSKKEIVRYVASIELSVPFGVVYKEHGYLTDQVIESGLKALKTIKELCAHHKAKRIIAIGTEVFRKARNGLDFFEQVKTHTGIDIQLVSQEQEAMLGFLSGKASLSSLEHLKHLNGREVIVYDSGGGSFQISTQEHNKLKVYMKAYGTAPSYSDLMRIKGIKTGFLDSTPNPCTRQEIERLVETISKHLLETDEQNNEDCAWLNAMEVIAIGSLNSIFRMASDFLGSTPHYTLADIERVVFEILPMKTDADLEPLYRLEPGMEPPSYCVPKLALLFTVMRHTRIQRIHFARVIGSCPGILISI